MMMRFLVVGILALMPASALAQSLDIPPNWREPNSNRSLSERISIAQKAIDTMVPQLSENIGQFYGIFYGQSGNVMTVMANQDRYAGTTVNKALVVENLNLVFKVRPEYDEQREWAQAAVAAYRAYNDTNLLSHAMETWDYVTNFVITPDEAKSSVVPGKNFAISGQCDGQTMAGGVFLRPGPDERVITSKVTGFYTALSALLADTTGDPKYTNAAILSARWIKQLNLNTNTSIVLDFIDAVDCSRSAATFLSSEDTGKYIEALAVIADVTKDQQWLSLMVTIAAAAMRDAPWQGSDGIITEGTDTTNHPDTVGYKAIVIRGLAEAYERDASNSDLQNLLRAYVNVQFNALLELAANGTSYAADWRGPPPQAFNNEAQSAALDVFTTAILVNN